MPDDFFEKLPKFVWINFGTTLLKYTIAVRSFNNRSMTVFELVLKIKLEMVQGSE